LPAGSDNARSTASAEAGPPSAGDQRTENSAGSGIVACAAAAMHASTAAAMHAHCRIIVRNPRFPPFGVALEFAIAGSYKIQSSLRP
jgi:hypothetical protein